jgi:hypothetical protein
MFCTFLDFFLIFIEVIAGLGLDYRPWMKFWLLRETMLCQPGMYKPARELYIADGSFARCH